MLAAETGWVVAKSTDAWPCGLLSCTEAALVLNLLVLREAPGTAGAHAQRRRHCLSCFRDFLLWILGHWFLVKQCFDMILFLLMVVRYRYDIMYHYYYFYCTVQ